MDTFDGVHPLPIPEHLHWDRVRLKFSEFVEANEVIQLAPRYVFSVLGPNGSRVGNITFRVGDNWHILFAAGHIGYRIDRESQGHGYAYQACRALAPFIRTRYDRVIITTSLTNMASIKTIERLGATFLGIVDIPENDPAYASGDMRRRRYEWDITHVPPSD